MSKRAELQVFEPNQALGHCLQPVLPGVLPWMDCPKQRCVGAPLTDKAKPLV